MNLLVEMPIGCESEKKYIVQIILDQFLGLNYTLKFTNSLQTIRITEAGSQELILQDVFFRRAAIHWLEPNTLPELPLRKVRLSESSLSVASQYDDLPVLFGKLVENNVSPVSISDSLITCHIDVFGSCFFLLSRYEEAVTAERDQYDRFPYSASVLSQGGLISRPLVNEYLELLWSCLKRLWPTLIRQPRSYRLMLTHDVDWPLSMPHLSVGGFCKKVAAALFIYRSMDLMWRRTKGFVLGKLGYYDADPFNTFEFIMNTAERHGVRSAYYFITDHTAGLIDGLYTMKDPWIRKLLISIRDRGHEIGLHGSFNAYNNQSQIDREIGILRSTCEEEGIALGAIGGRQHYLRWSALSTWDIWDRVGLSYDSTVGFAEQAGFRTGTCYEYSAYSLKNRKILTLKERPLLVMDGTLISNKYMNLTTETAKHLALDIIKTCKFYNGDFVCLFHNSNLETKLQKKLFTEIISAAI
jgi:hypothetical protein